ncbi:MAG: hypothetical protein COB17_08035 [Sulfurimonas sp.]|nr:MAG: hypothetical protein COB17_08035 [Sulfurimonas sp.]
MQTFGIFTKNIGHDYLTKQYIYIQENDETITSSDLEIKLKKKSKNVLGTIFLFNPSITPIGFNMDSSLEEQGYESYDKFAELEFDRNCILFASAIKDGYRGKLLEIRYLYNYNYENIEPTPIMEEFDADLDRFTSGQLTRYDKFLNYQDYTNLSLNGKFVFFASGNKYDRHHKAIIDYARSLSSAVQKLGKELIFMYDKNYNEQESKEVAYFLPILAHGKLRDIRANAFKKSFSTNPPTIQRLG